jgi:hypothetical protein
VYCARSSARTWRNAEAVGVGVGCGNGEVCPGYSARDKFRPKAARVYLERRMSQVSVDQGAFEVIEQQLDAYNDRDIERFLRCFHDDCQYYEFPNKLLASGKEDIRKRHIERFKDTALLATLIHRMGAGDMVIDQEVVVRTFPEGKGEVDVISIYQVRDGKIANAWFKIGSPRII